MSAPIADPLGLVPWDSGTAEPDPRDTAVWQSNHDTWTRLVAAGLEERRGRAPEWYCALLDEIRGKNGLLWDG
jgi:hypothetical protein